MRYMLEPVQITYYVSIFKGLLDFTSLQVKSYKQLQIYENEHFQLEYRSTSCIFQVRYYGLF